MSKDDDPRMQTGTTCVQLPQTLRTNKKKQPSSKLQKLVCFFVFGFFLYFVLCKQTQKLKTKRKKPKTPEITNSRNTNTREELHNQKQQQQQQQWKRERERERERERAKEERI